MKQKRALRLAGLFLAVVIAIVGCALVWNNLLRDYLTPKRFVAVEPGKLYRSGQISSGLIRDVLIDHEIALVVDLNGLEPKWREHQDAEQEAVASLGVDYMRFPLIGDGTGRLKHFAQAIAAIHAAEKSGQPTLVHCAAGARRTGAVIALYQVLVQGIPTEQAIYELGRYGSPLKDSAMLSFVNRQMRPLAVRLQKDGIIEQVPDPIPQFRLP